MECKEIQGMSNTVSFSALTSYSKEVSAVYYWHVPQKLMYPQHKIHTHSHTLIHPHSHTHALTYTIPSTHTYAHSHTHSHSLTHTHTPTHTHTLSVVTADIVMRQHSKFNSPYSVSPRHMQAQSLSFGKTYTKQQNISIRHSISHTCDHQALTGKTMYSHPTQDATPSLHYGNCTVQSH
jgi:hypothetical protein